MEPTVTIASRVIKTELINWIDLKFIQQEDFKSLPPESYHKLRASIIANNFTQPFYVWQDPAGFMWCLDGFHRYKVLKDIESVNGGNLPPAKLPATFIDCMDIKEAAKLVLLFSSQYARVTEKGFINFIGLNDLDLKELDLQIDIPKFNPIEGVKERKENDAVAFDDNKQFFLNIKCDDEQHAEQLYETLLSQGLDVKIVT